MTLVEVLVALVLLGVIGGVVMRVVLRQQQFYQGANQIMSTRSQLRQATSVLPIDLRNLSSVGDDILAVTDSSIDLRVNVGTGIVCQVIDGSHVALPPRELDSKQTLTSWVGGKVPDDDGSVVVHIYNDSSITGNEDDYWQRFRLRDVDSSTAVCPGPAFTTVLDLGKYRPILELSSTDPPDPVTGGPISQYIRVGSAVRLTKLVRYMLYKKPDGKSYLGYSEFDRALGKFKQLDPVSGPYDPRAGGESGVSFRYYDVDGNEILPDADDDERARIARIDLIVRGRTSSEVKVDGMQNGARQQYRDSLAVSVMLRNRT